MPETKKKERRLAFAYLLTNLVAVIISMLATVISSGIADLTATAAAKGYGLVALGFMALLVIMTVLVSRFRRGPTKVAALKDSLINAFCGALESSPLNPKAKKGGI